MFFLFRSYGHFNLFIWSSDFLFIRSSGFGLLEAAPKFCKLRLKSLQVIALSGSATTPFMHYDRNPRLYGQAFAQHFGAKTDMTDQVILLAFPSVFLLGLLIQGQKSCGEDWYVGTFIEINAQSVILHMLPLSYEIKIVIIKIQLRSYY